MIDSSLLDLGTTSLSFIGSALVSHISKSSRKQLEMHEKERERSHTREMAILKLNSQAFNSVQTNSLKNTNASRFIGTTRRILALMVPFLFISIVICSFFHIDIVYPVENTYHFLGLSLTKHSQLVINGFLWLPWFKEWVFMVSGFYFGRMAIS